MNVTDPIITTALLGTSTKELSVEQLPEVIKDLYTQIQGDANDLQDSFYRIAAITMAYQRSGSEVQSADNKEITIIPEAPQEEKPYLNESQGQLLKDLTLNHQFLLLYAYQKAVSIDRLVPSVYLPPLIKHAYEHHTPLKREEQLLLSRLAGKCGRWLLPYMGLKDWGDTDNEDWETASHESRKQMLRYIREQDPTQGLLLLQTGIKSESAAHRDDLIQCLEVNLNKDDEPFLKELIETDRSKNVKQSARELLFRIPDSDLVQQFCTLLRQHISHRYLLGWSYKTIEYTPDIKALGIEEVSSIKGEKDSDYILRQLAEHAPLSFWAEIFNCSLEKSARRLAKDPPFGKQFDLKRPIQNYSDRLWAYHTLIESPTPDHVQSLIGLLSAKEREEIKFQSHTSKIEPQDSWFLIEEEWGPIFSSKVIDLLTKDTSYYYDKELLERLAISFPHTMINKVQTLLQTHQLTERSLEKFNLLLDNMKLKNKIDTLFDHK